MDPISIGALAVGLGPLLGNLFGGGKNNGVQDYTKLLQQIPELREMLSLQTQQARMNAPLHQAMVQLSMNLLPKSSRSAYPGVPDISQYGGLSPSRMVTRPNPNGGTAMPRYEYER